MKTRKVSQQAIVDELVNYLMLGGGILVGTIGGKAADRMLGVDPSLPGFNAKGLVKPLAQLGLGIAGSLKLRNTKLKMFSGGVGASGVISSVEMLTGRSLLAGLTDSLGNPQPQVGNFFPGVRSFQPELPSLRPGHSEPGYELSYGHDSSVELVESSDFEII